MNTSLLNHKMKSRGIQFSLSRGVPHVLDRKAIIGCPRDARRAGTYVASRVTAPRAIATPAYVTGSVGATP
jgi:hypothetical protein